MERGKSRQGNLLGVLVFFHYLLVGESYSRTFSSSLRKYSTRHHICVRSAIPKREELGSWKLGRKEKSEVLRRGIIFLHFLPHLSILCGVRTESLIMNMFIKYFISWYMEVTNPMKNSLLKSLYSQKGNVKNTFLSVKTNWWTKFPFDLQTMDLFSHNTLLTSNCSIGWLVIGDLWWSIK